MKTIIVYHYRGGVERGTGNGYAWRDGYSENSAEGWPTYPWMTARECQEDARKRGAIAKFEVERGRLPKQPEIVCQAPL